MIKQLIIAGALLMFAGPVLAQKTTPPTKTSRATTTFVKNATAGSTFVAESSQLAAQKAQNPDVKSFAQKLVDEAGKKRDELKQIVEQAGMPTVEPVLDARRAAAMRRLQTMPAGAKFDRAYMDSQSTALNGAMSRLRRYSRLGDNPQLKQFAASALPMIEDDLKQLKSLKSVKTSRTEKKG